MSKVFFKIGNTDFSSAVDVQNYDVNDLPVYDSWTDINRVEHRTYIRSRLQGRFSLGYSTEANYAAAVSAIRTARGAAGYTSCSLWSNNDGSTRTADCYLHLTGAARWDLHNSRQWQTLEVEVFER